MAITASGIGSGLDINGLVTSLVQAEREPVDQRLLQQQTRAQSQLSATATLQGVLGSFRSAVQALNNPATYQARSATSSSPENFTATAQNNAAAGNYSIEVVALAEAQKLASAGFASENDAVGQGTLSFSAGDSSFDVTIGASNDSLTGLRDAINSASGNDFVRATIINTDAGKRLVLTANDTGLDNAFAITATGGLTQFTNINMTTVAAAADAALEVEGFTLFSASNTVSDAIDGVTLNLVKADIGTTFTLTVAQNQSAVLNAAGGFVAAWNSVNATIRGLSQVSPEGQASVLTGDGVLRGIAEQLRRELSTPGGSINDPFSTLSEVGIRMQLDGSLKLDEPTFSAAMAANPVAVQSAFTGENGYAKRLNDTLGNMLATNGALAARTTGLTDRLKAIAAQREALDTRMQAFEARYRQQFGALDELVARLRSTSDFLAAQLANLQK